MPRGSKPGERRGGRQAGAKNKVTVEIKAIAQQYTAAALKELARLASEASSEAARVAAIKELLDRGHGKAIQYTEGNLQVNIHEGARERFAAKLDRILNPGTSDEAPRVIN